MPHGSSRATGKCSCRGAFALAFATSFALVSALSSCTSSSDDSDDPSRSSVAPSEPEARGVDAGVADPQSQNPVPSCEPPPSLADGVADVDVSIDTGRGPKGHAAPVPITRNLYGMNIADWVPADYAPTLKPTYFDLLSALRPGVLRWPAGHRSQEYVWQRGGGGQTGNWTLTPALVDAFIALTKAVGAEPLFAINVKRGTVSSAQDLLHYLNVERGYGVRWLQIGNEPDLTDGMTSGPDQYSGQLEAFVDGLRAVDPSIRIVGPEMLTGAHVSGVNNTLDWMLPILARAGGRIDGISWHYYPLDSAQRNPASSAIMSTEHLFQESAKDWRPAAMAYVDEIMPKFAQLRAAHAPNAEVWVTELAEDPGPGAGAGISETLAGALWVGDILGRYGEYGPGAVLRWHFKGSLDHAYGLLGPNDVPRPAYGAYWLYARHFGDRFVESASSASGRSAITEVAVHAALVLVNKKAEPRRVRLTIAGFVPCSAEELTLKGASLSATEFDINGTALTATTAKSGIEMVALDVAHLLDVELPPTSMRLLLYRR
jgi:hypothetical protein